MIDCHIIYLTLFLNLPLNFINQSNNLDVIHLFLDSNNCLLTYYNLFIKSYHYFRILIVV